MFDKLVISFKVCKKTTPIFPDTSIFPKTSMTHTTKTLLGALVLLASAVSVATNGTAHITEKKNTRAKAAANTAFIINEIMVDNTDMFLDPSLNYGSWIEIYNPTDATINLKNYYVSDDPSNPKKFHLQSGTVKPHAFANIWFDHYEANLKTQVNFKLSTEGGTVLIADASGKSVVVEYVDGEMLVT